MLVRQIVLALKHLLNVDGHRRGAGEMHRNAYCACGARHEGSYRKSAVLETPVVGRRATGGSVLRNARSIGAAESL